MSSKVFYSICAFICSVVFLLFSQQGFAVNDEIKDSRFFTLANQSPLPKDLSIPLGSKYVQSQNLAEQQFIYWFADTTLFRFHKNRGKDSSDAVYTFSHNITAASYFNEAIYSVVKDASPRIYKIELNTPDTAKPIAVVPFNKTINSTPVAFNHHLYLILDGQLSRYDNSSQTWIPLGPKIQISNAIGVVAGHSHLGFVERSSSSTKLCLFQVDMQKWIDRDEFTLSTPIKHAVVTNNLLNVVTSNKMYEFESKIDASMFSYLDYAILVILMALLLFVGVHQSKKDNDGDDYFKAKQRIPWWAASLSIFATNSSAITLMAMPAMAFSSNWIYFSIGIFLLVIQVPLFSLVYVPVIRRLKITTANHYLEMRFGLSARLLGFMGFSLNQVLGRMAAIMLLPATALNAIFGLDMNHSIIIMGICTTVFVTLGGLSAVIWTDVIQAFIMIIAVFVCGYFALIAIDAPLPDMHQVLADRDKLKMFDLRLDWAAPVVIVLFLNSLATSLTYIGDQNYVQRVQCTSTESAAKKAAISQLFVAVPLNFLLFSLGTLLFLYYFYQPELLPPALAQDGVLPYFASQTLPAGLTGLVVVALLAATISTVSSAMNSVANLCVEDVYLRFSTHANPNTTVRIARILTLCIGVFGTLAALFLANISSLKSLWDLFLMVTGMILSPITGMFVLGVFTKKANLIGVWVGVICAIGVNYYFIFHSSVHPMVYIIVGTFSTIIVGYLASFVGSAQQNKLDELTVFTLKQGK